MVVREASSRGSEIESDASRNIVVYKWLIVMAVDYSAS
jgi:hypothetical protein